MMKSNILVLLLLLVICYFSTYSLAFYTLGNATSQYDVVAVHISTEVSDLFNSLSLPTPVLLPKKLAELHGYVHLGQIGTLPNYHLFVKSADHSRSIHPPLISHPLILSAHPQTPLSRTKRTFTTPLDPLYSRQWHLHQTHNSPHINVVPVWEHYTLGSPNISVGIVDDGLQTTHPDLSPNYVGAFSWDFMENKNDPSPINIDTHGSSASGCVGAAVNRVCGVGAAPGVKIAGLRIMKGDFGVNDAGEGGALSFKCENGNDIYTCSWGPFDDGKRLEGPGAVARAAIDHCIKSGRKGKGTIYVWAGGNGASAGDNINYDGYANRRETIAVGAITDRGTRGYYSEPGSPLLIMAPSSGGSAGIPTTSFHGIGGSECTNNFGGTSAASPIAAGAVALILSVNPNLGWRDVQHILVNTATKNGITSLNSFTKNGAGFNHSLEFGFGIIDTYAAVQLAQNWTNVAQDKVIRLTKSPAGDERLPIGSGKNQKLVRFEVKAQDKFVVEHVEVHVNLVAYTRGRVDLYLIAPSGMTSPLQENHIKDGSSNMDWSFWSVRHWGENPNGVWNVKLVNNGQREGRLSNVNVNLYGYYTS